jgi:hypothetical protein
MGTVPIERLAQTADLCKMLDIRDGAEFLISIIYNLFDEIGDSAQQLDAPKNL